jgi:CheY-like chemotaxis protein
MTDTNDPNEKTVLIVDDVDYSRQLLRNAILAVCDQNKLSTKHFKIVNAANGMGALQKISETSPDLIFLDIELPDANGISKDGSDHGQRPKYRQQCQSRSYQRCFWLYC